MDIVLLRSQLEKHPPNINYIQKIVNTFKQGLFKFVPNKPEIHEMIESDLPLDTIGPSSISHIIDRLIHWIEQFQAPSHDSITTTWRKQFANSTSDVDFICTFVIEYKNHTELVYKERWKALMRLANNENIVPPEYRTCGNGL